MAAAGAGPCPISYKNISTESLTDALRFCLREDASAAAKGIAEQMKGESGVRRAVASFHANLPLETMRCNMMPDQPATWSLKKDGRYIRLSKEAAGILLREGQVAWNDLKRYAIFSVHLPMGFAVTYEI